MTLKYDPPTTPERTTRGSPRPAIVNSTVEKSPSAPRVRTRDCRSRISGTEKFAFSDADAARALADVDQAVFVAVDERPQEDAADDAENRRIGANAKRQGDHDGDRQAFDPAQRPQRKPEISDEAHKHLED